MSMTRTRFAPRPITDGGVWPANRKLAGHGLLRDYSDESASRSEGIYVGFAAIR
jgi:hypothetical protein